MVALAGLALIAVAGSRAGAAATLSPVEPVAARTFTPAPRSGAAGTGPAVAATNRLALALLAHLDTSANTIVSPLSIETALAMVDQGASGTTAAQLDTLLGHAASPAILAASNGRLAGALRTAATGYGSGGPVLNSANALWLQSGLRLDRPFATTLATDFAAPPQQTDFASDPAGAIEAINAWVSQRTDGLITHLMSPAEVTTATTLVLANAVYLNARWRTQFDPNATEKGPFHTATSTVTVPFMDSGSLSRYPYDTLSGYQAVALPYAHSSLQFLAVLPPAGAIGTLERWLTPPHLRTLTRSLRTQPVEVQMPKFTLSFAASLDTFLEHEGVTSAFGPASDLNRMVPGPALAITAVQHAATLEVAEKGTVAAAATGVTVAPTAVAEPLSRHIVLNRPFLVLIRDTRTGTILFAARVLDPSTQ
jgi:serpin B